MVIEYEKDGALEEQRNKLEKQIYEMIESEKEKSKMQNKDRKQTSNKKIGKREKKKK